MPQIETFMSSKTAMFGLASVAFLVALLLVVVIVKMLIGGRLRIPGGRARQARLGIVDAFEFGRQRQLIIVRRDNIEHLIMIGGPNDLLIESEIVRVEARDARDGRRDKQDAFPSSGDTRIPAPFTPASDRPEPKLPDEPRVPTLDPAFTPPVPTAPAPVPTLDIPPPATEPVETPVRTPTFPLPSRRPMPAPPRLPESVSRGDDAPPAIATPVIEGPAPPPPPVVAAESNVSAPEPVVAAPPPPPAARTAPPFLKPLPPRPPLRPLQRTTPQPPMLPAPASETSSDGGPAPVVVPPKPRPPLSTAIPKPTPKPAQVPPPPPEPQDVLESLEEEMAKLLGRGPS